MDDPLAVSYRRHFDHVYRFVRRRATAAEAEDLTQDVFAAAAVALAEARVEAPPPLAWLYTVARRRLVDLARRQVSPESPSPNDRPVGERTYGPQVGRDLAAAFGELTDAQRRVIVLKLFDDRSFAEIGALLDSSESACKMRFSRGLARLREELERKGIAG
jgi:RNA polymerase sigma-70 factor (ECF subfamily)